MTNEQIRQQIVDMIPFAHMERFETLWTMLTPKHERLSMEQIKQQQELENEREVFWSALEDVVCSVVGIQSQMLIVLLFILLLLNEFRYCSNLIASSASLCMCRVWLSCKCDCSFTRLK